MHEVLVNRLGGLSLPRKSVVRLTDRLDMTLDVYRGRKTTIQYNNMSRTCIQTTYLQACIYTDGGRQEGWTIGRTNKRKKNIQTDRVINNITKNAYMLTDRHTDGRIHRQTILELVDRGQRPNWA